MSAAGKYGFLHIILRLSHDWRGHAVISMIPIAVHELLAILAANLLSKAVISRGRSEITLMGLMIRTERMLLSCTRSRTGLANWSPENARLPLLIDESGT
ncbi:hypothetical protein J6590_005574 [Homalodisca vitripennis]|nr:hypothetical protein J6590_005574 [Homalodisca vitripennis]